MAYLGYFQSSSRKTALVELQSGQVYAPARHLLELLRLPLQAHCLGLGFRVWDLGFRVGTVKKV